MNLKKFTTSDMDMIIDDDMTELDNNHDEGKSIIDVINKFLINNYHFKLDSDRKMYKELYDDEKCFEFKRNVSEITNLPSKGIIESKQHTLIMEDYFSNTGGMIANEKFTKEGDDSNFKSDDGGVYISFDKVLSIFNTFFKSDTDLVNLIRDKIQSDPMMSKYLQDMKRVINEDSDVRDIILETIQLLIPSGEEYVRINESVDMVNQILSKRKKDHIFIYNELNIFMRKDVTNHIYSKYSNILHDTINISDINIVIDVIPIFEVRKHEEIQYPAPISLCVRVNSEIIRHHKMLNFHTHEICSSNCFIL